MHLLDKPEEGSGDRFPFGPGSNFGAEGGLLCRLNQAVGVVGHDVFVIQETELLGVVGVLAHGSLDQEFEGTDHLFDIVLVGEFEVGGASAAGDEPNKAFGESHLGFGGGDDGLAASGDFVTSTEAETVDGGDGRGGPQERRERLELTDGLVDFIPGLGFDPFDEELEIETDRVRFCFAADDPFASGIALDEGGESTDDAGGYDSHFRGQSDGEDVVAEVADIEVGLLVDQREVGERAEVGFGFGGEVVAVVAEDRSLVIVGEPGGEADAFSAEHVDHGERAGFPSEPPHHDAVEILDVVADFFADRMGVPKGREEIFAQELANGVAKVECLLETFGEGEFEEGRDGVESVGTGFPIAMGLEVEGQELAGFFFVEALACFASNPSLV